MYKQLLLAAAGLMLALSANAQKKTGARPAFDAGDNAIGIAAGFGPAHTYSLANSYSPAFIINYEHGIVPNLGPGTLAIGGELGWQTSRYNYDYGGYRARWTTFTFAVRGIYHLTILKDKNNKFDPYGGLAAGAYFVSYDNDAPGAEHYGSAPFVAPFVGAKYNFTPNFGAWSELGWDIAAFKIGLNFNF